MILHMGMASISPWHKSSKGEEGRLERPCGQDGDNKSDSPLNSSSHMFRQYFEIFDLNLRIIFSAHWPKLIKVQHIRWNYLVACDGLGDQYFLPLHETPASRHPIGNRYPEAHSETHAKPQSVPCSHQVRHSQPYSLREMNVHRRQLVKIWVVCIIKFISGPFHKPSICIAVPSEHFHIFTSLSQFRSFPARSYYSHPLLFCSSLALSHLDKQ